MSDLDPAAPLLHDEEGYERAGDWWERFYEIVRSVPDDRWMSIVDCRARGSAVGPATETTQAVPAIEAAEGSLDNMDSITALVGRVGCIYTKRNVSPPFKLRACAEGWLSDGITPTHVAECIERHLNENHRRYYSGSGDGGLPLVDREIRESWRQLQRPPRARPARTDRLYKRTSVFDDRDEWLADSARRTARPVDLKTIDKAELGGERWDVPRRHPDQASALPTAAPHRPHAAPSHATRLRPVDRAVAFLREELAHGEVAVAEVEANAKYEGISLRTLDRARTQLKVVSRRRGFGKVGGFWLSVPPPVSAAKDATKSRGEQG